MEDLKSKILEDLKVAMKEKNTSKLEAVRATKAAVDKFEKENPGQPINYVKALKPLVKQREDSIEQFRLAGNTELMNKESAELEVINSYLSTVMPKQLSKEELEKIVNEYIYSSGNNTGTLPKSDMGKIMSYFKSNYEGQYDGKELNNMVRTVLV